MKKKEKEREKQELTLRTPVEEPFLPPPTPWPFVPPFLVKCRCSDVEETDEDVEVEDRDFFPLTFGSFACVINKDRH